MKKIFVILILSFSTFYGCLQNKNIHDKFDTIKNIDYSEFNDMSIVNRKGVYFVTYHEITYKIEVNSFAKKTSSMKIVFNKDTSTLFTKQDSVHIEHALKSFRDMRVLALSVDKKENVLLSIPWYDRCTYYFLKLSPTNTLEDIKKQYYQNYENNWYLDKECSER